MRNRLLKVLLLVSAAAGGVVWWQRRNETPPTPPDASPTRLPPAEPFLDPVLDRDIDGAGPPATSDRPVRPSTPTPPADALTAADEVVSPTPLPDPPREPFTTAPDGPPDDLKRITGIGPTLESLLNAQGITTFAQLAALSDEDIDELQERIPEFPDRMRRDRWIEQAERLSDA